MVVPSEVVEGGSGWRRCGLRRGAGSIRTIRFLSCRLLRQHSRTTVWAKTMLVSSSARMNMTCVNAVAGRSEVTNAMSSIDLVSIGRIIKFFRWVNYFLTCCEQAHDRDAEDTTDEPLHAAGGALGFAIPLSLPRFLLSMVMVLLYAFLL